MTYNQHFQRSITDREGFWGEQAQKLPWYRPADEVLSKDEKGLYRWFKGGMLNTCFLAIDRHVEEGRGDQVAIYYDSPVTQNKEQITYRHLRERVARFAGVLKQQGVGKGDRVIIYMPMIPQAVVAMLACARLGAIHSVVFGGFAPHELAVRIDDAQPKVLVTASSGIEVDRIIPYKPMVDEAIAQAEHKVEKVIIYQRKLGALVPAKDYDLDYEELMAKAEWVGCTPVEANDPLYILYTSGTTGKPKGVIREHGGHAVALNYSMEHIYGVGQGDVYWAASDIGWVVGHSYIVYAPLIVGASTVLFEGKPIRTPDASTFWRVISEYRVKVMFTAPTAIRAIRKEDPQGDFIKAHDLSCLKYQFLAGERCDVDTLHWLRDQLQIPVIDHWWQTESGWPMLSNFPGMDLMPVKDGSVSKPVAGYDLQILNELGEEVDPGEEGYVAVKLPLPPGCLPTLWRNDQRFIDGYLKRFPAYYFSGDGGYQDEEGYVYITGRVDDIINVAGHRLSTVEMEEVVAAHPMVAECAVIGANDQLKGQIPLGLVVLNQELENTHDLIEELIQAVRREIGPVAAFKTVVPVKRLPKTRSGKILRKLLRQMANNEEYQIPSTIDDPAIVAEIKERINLNVPKLNIS